MKRINNNYNYKQAVKYFGFDTLFSLRGNEY